MSSLTISKGAFFLRQQTEEQWVPDEVIRYAHELCALTCMRVHIRFGIYDTGEAVAGVEPRWFTVYPYWDEDTADDHIAAFNAGKDRLHGTAGVGGELEDDAPLPVGYVSNGARTMLSQGGKAIIHSKRDDLNCHPLYSQYRSRYQ